MDFNAWYSRSQEPRDGSGCLPLYNHLLLTESQRDRIEVVLVSPRNPLNIGAAARAMANFGFARLAVVAPYEEHWREAKSAVGASDLLQNARRVGRLAEAVADCTLVVGTGTLAHRKPEQTVIPLPELAPFVDAELTRGGRVALVFGPEKRGLTREDLALCHVFVEIPTDSRQPSMNLGQAVAVCLYELAARSKTDAHPSDRNKGVARVGHPDPVQAHAAPASTRDAACASDPARACDLELLAEVVAETMQVANYSPAAMRKANRHDLELLLRRIKLERRDARRILGLFRRILWRLKWRVGLKG
jgi:TrmH family RNA methyltransferase